MGVNPPKHGLPFQGPCVKSPKAPKIRSMSLGSPHFRSVAGHGQASAGGLRCQTWISGGPRGGCQICGTLLETKMSPKKGLIIDYIFQEGIYLPIIDFQGTC